MAKRVYIGVDNKARKVKKTYIGVDGIARKIKKIYMGVNNVAKCIYTSAVDVVKTVIVAGDASSSKRTLDGSTFETITLGANVNSRLIYGNGIFTDGKQYSIDGGNTWVCTTGINENIEDYMYYQYPGDASYPYSIFLYMKDKFVYVCNNRGTDNRRIMVSSDAINWNVPYSNLTYYVQSGIYNKHIDKVMLFLYTYRASSTSSYTNNFYCEFDGTTLVTKSLNLPDASSGNNYSINNSCYPGNPAYSKGIVVVPYFIATQNDGYHFALYVYKDGAWQSDFSFQCAAGTGAYPFEYSLYAVNGTFYLETCYKSNYSFKTIYKSTNGISWSEVSRDYNSDARSYRAPVYLNGKYYSLIKNNSSATPTVYYSTDEGASWVYTNISNSGYKDICSSEELPE